MWIDCKDRDKFLIECFVGHNETPEVLAVLNNKKIRVRKLVACATDKVQACDSFVISKIKDEWMEMWDEYKFNAIKNGRWKDGEWGDGQSSGALQNPGKTFFLKLAAEAVRKVNAQRDKNGISYARKAMIRCGLSLDVTGEWRVKQLSVELQKIIHMYKNHYDGEPVPPFSDLPDQRE